MRFSGSPINREASFRGWLGRVLASEFRVLMTFILESAVTALLLKILIHALGTSDWGLAVGSGVVSLVGIVRSVSKAIQVKSVQSKAAAKERACIAVRGGVSLTAMVGVMVLASGAGLLSAVVVIVAVCWFLAGAGSLAFTLLDGFLDSRAKRREKLYYDLRWKTIVMRGSDF